MGQKLGITRELAWKIKQEYEERDERGTRKWSQARLAARYMISETTVFRAVNNLGAYGVHSLPEVKGEDARSRDAAVSLRNLLRMQEMPIPPEVEAAAEGRAMTAAERMAHDAGKLREQASRGDDLLNELNGGVDGTAGIKTGS